MAEHSTILARRRFLIGGTVAGLLSLGGFGCGSSSGHTIPVSGGGLLTITPTRAAPGAIVTIGGIGAVPDGGTIDVRFGEVPGTVIGLAVDGSGLQVVVPPFLKRGSVGDERFRHVPPPGPVPITVTVLDANGTHMSTAAAGQALFTVDALPASPGAAAATIASTVAFVETISGLFTGGLLSVANDIDPENTDPTLRYGALQGAALLGSLSDLLNGPNNPNSLAAILQGTAPVLGGVTPSPGFTSLVDSMAAQNGMTQRMQTLVSDIGDIVRQVAPEALVTRSEVGGSRQIGTIIALNIAWNTMSPIARYVTAMYVQQKISAFTNSNGLAAGELVIAIVTPLVSALAVGALASGPGIVTEPVIDVVLAALYAEGIATKMLSLVASLMPSKVADFFVLVNNTGRVDSTIPIAVPLGKILPLKLQFAPMSQGGQTLSLLGLIQLIVETLGKTGTLKAFIQGGSPKQRQFLFDTLFSQFTSIFDFLWKKFAGTQPPSNFYSSYGIITQPVKFAAVDINDRRFATVTTKSTEFLFAGVDPQNAKAFILIGKKVTTNDNQAGFRAQLLEYRPTALLPSLVEIAGNKSEVRGVVRIKGLNVKPSIR